MRRTGKMLFLLTILVVLLTVTSFAVFVKRRNSNLLQQNSQTNLSAENFRPLFAPDEEEIRAFENEKKLLEKKYEQEETRRLLMEKAEKVSAFQTKWQESPDQQTTVELIYLASQCESAEIYQETAEKVLESWKTAKIRNLSVVDLCRLLESHFWLLPNEERTSGVSFWLKKEIASLRRESLEKN